MASEIRANTLKNRVGLGTVSFTNTGPVVSGIVTATTFVGALTGTASGNPTLANGANNRIITATGANALTGESNLTWTGAYFETNGGSETWTMRARSGGPSSKIGFQNQYLANGYIVGCGADNKSFVVYTNGQNNGERLRIDQTGISTFYQNLFASKDFDVDGHTNLDNVSVVGFTTIGQGNFAYTPQSSSWATSSAINLIGNYGGALSFNDNGNGGFVQYLDGNGSNFNIKSGAIGGATETSIKCVKDGSVELYHNGNKKLETSSSGATVTGTLSATTFSGSGASLTNLPVADSDIQVAYTVTANGSSAYRFAGNGVVSSADNPDLYLIRGQKYRFINNSGGSHPFQIREASGGTAYSTGVTNNGASSGNIDFAPTYDSPAQLVYQCTSHSGMVGNIYLRDAAGNNTNVGVTTFIGHVQANNIKLDRGSAQDVALRISTTSSTGASRISFDESGTSKGQVSYSHDNDQIELSSASGNGLALITNGFLASNAALKINSSGHVTKPKNPVFNAYGGPSNVNSNTDIVFSVQRFAVGGGYNTSTGEYTAPTTGYYHFYAQVYRQTTSNDSWWGFYLDTGSGYSQISEARMENDYGGDSGRGYSTLQSSIYWYMTAGHKIKCRVGNGAIHCNTTLSYFCGNLVG